MRVKLATVVDSFSDRSNLGQAFAEYLTRIVGRIDEYRRKKGRSAIARFLAMTFVGSLLTVAFASHFASHQEDRIGIIELATNYPAHTIAALLGMSLFSTGFNLVSAFVTYRIFEIAGGMKTLLAQIIHLFAQIVVIAIATLIGLSVFMLLIFYFSSSTLSFFEYF